MTAGVGRPLATDRRDPMARALARIIATVDLVDADLPVAMVEAIEMGRAALADRDNEYTGCVVVIGGTVTEGAQWAERNQVEGGARCWPIASARELSSYGTPVTVVVLPGAADRDDWPQLAGQLAALGSTADVIRVRR